MAIAQEIRCSHCGAPVEFNPGELTAICKYCGFTTVVETGQVFTFEHSLLLNKYTEAQMENQIKDWMREGFMKPSDLARKSKITEKTLSYLPFWIISVEAKSTYKGIFERISPPLVKEGIIARDYDWLVLARKGSVFPTREYDVPMDGKIPFDFRRIEGFAKILNSEIDKDAAVDIAKQEIENHHSFLLKQDVDKIIDLKTDFIISQVVYLHAPLWFVKYDYKGDIYNLIMDGATGNALKGDIPSSKFGVL